uniref:Scorpine-like-1 n=1 Tax=Urodacus yaschenkoi TaxID=1273102 RepID=KBX31_UROYA|nr:RecName: Full=Scorpine-like-1; Short=SCl1; Short=UySCl1; Flags: Precursor [Urodacus yaschenkoi]AGA82758.1 antimicrobial peptide SC11 precursor [Urodacus yaschenkoi]
MNTKFTVLIFLGVIVVSYGWITEKKIQKVLDEKLPNGFIKGAAKAVVHKLAKSEYGCMMDISWNKDCQRHCQSTEQKDGICHGMKCKCGKPRSY